MRFVRYLQHWLSGTGARLPVTDFVPESHPIRQWADTFPWAALVSAIEQSFDTRFPKPSPRGRRPVPIRVLFALELLKHELGASDEDICHRLRTDFAVMYACGLRDYQVNPAQAHFVLPETLCEFRRRIDEPLMRLSQQAHERLAQTTALPETQRERLLQALTTAMRAHAHIRVQSKRLTQ